jgi:outer membrane lipoprotein
MLTRMLSLLAPAAAAAVLLCGCSSPFAKELLGQVDPAVSFAGLLRDPERYRGSVVMLGGTIVAVRNLKEGSEVEVVQKPLDGEGRPEQTDETGGRFLAVVPQFLDAAVFQRGRSITLIGAAEGARTQPLGEIEYRYPVLTAKQVHLWPPSAGPWFSIGIGVYRGF